MKDRFWQIVGAIATVVAVVVTIVTFYLSQRADEKGLTAEVISSSRLLNTELPTTGELKLIYKDKRIKNVAISNIRISNTGRQPILTSNIEVPLSIQLQCIDIISSKVVSSVPHDLPINTKIQVPSVYISKALLNPGDDFTIEIISIPNRPKGAVVSGVSGRIAGIGQIKFESTLQREKRKKPYWESILAGLIAGILALLLIRAIIRFYNNYLLETWPWPNQSIKQNKRD